MSKLAVQAGPEKRSVARYVRLCFFSVMGKFIPQNYACAATCLTCQSRVKGPQPIASHLREQKNARYRALADYEKTAQTYLPLENVNWQPVRELIIKRWQQVEAEVRQAFFIRYNEPEFVAARYDKRRGAYPSRLIYLPHEFHPLWGWCPLAIDRTGRVPVGTMAPHLKPEIRLATEEREGYEYLARKQQAHPDARAQVAGDLLRVAQILRHNPALNILLELGTPRLSQLSSGAGNALGYVAYFLECWQRFHEYENPNPAHAAGAELAPPSPNYMPSQPATPPAGPLPTLPGTVAGRLTYFDELLAACRRAKHLPDTAEILREAYEQHKSQGLYELADFMDRLPIYVVKELPSELRSHVESNILAKLRGEFRLFQLKPETWPVWAVSQRGEIIVRQEDVTERLALAESDARLESERRAVASWHARHGEKVATGIADSKQKKRIADVAAHQKTLARLGEILAALDTAAAAGIAFVTSRELGQLANPTTLALPASALANMPEPELDGPSVADLCCNGFTPADLTSLLQRLSVIDVRGNCLTNDLYGKARGRRGAFTAAYRVLHRAGLLAPTPTDKQWAAAFKKEYGVNLGTDVIAHQLTSHGHAPKSAPIPFQKATDDTNSWVVEWKNRRQSLFIAR